MKTLFIVILFIFYSQLLPQINDVEEINHREFLKERINSGSNPLALTKKHKLAPHFEGVGTEHKNEFI